MCESVWVFFFVCVCVCVSVRVRVSMHANRHESGWRPSCAPRPFPHRLLPAAAARHLPATTPLTPAAAARHLPQVDPAKAACPAACAACDAAWKVTSDQLTLPIFFKEPMQLSAINIKQVPYSRCGRGRRFAFARTCMLPSCSCKYARPRVLPGVPTHRRLPCFPQLSPPAFQSHAMKHTCVLRAAVADQECGRGQGPAAQVDGCPLHRPGDGQGAWRSCVRHDPGACVCVCVCTAGTPLRPPGRGGVGGTYRIAVSYMRTPVLLVAVALPLLSSPTSTHVARANRQIPLPLPAALRTLPSASRFCLSRWAPRTAASACPCRPPAHRPSSGRSW